MGTNTREFLPFEFEYLQRLSKDIKKYSDDGKPTLPLIKFIWLKELIYARVPRAYWNVSQIKDLNIVPEMRDLATGFVKKIDIAMENGLGLFFFGKNGRGKTSTGTSILIECMKLGIPCCYITAQTFIDFEKDFENSENRDMILSRVAASKVLFMDEFDATKIYINEKTKYALKKLENYLREYLSGNKVVILSGNLRREEITEAFNPSVFSLVQRNLKLVEFLGKDYSEKKQSIWDDIMSGKSNTFDKKNFTVNAKQYFQNVRGGK